MSSQRKLTEAEQRRLAKFEATSEELVAQGYKRINLGVSIFAASVISIVAIVVLFAVVMWLFTTIHPGAELFLSMLEWVITLVVFVVLIVVHELIHGLTWSRFTPNGFKDVEFGIMKNSLTPYCTCLAPLHKGAYILGTLMPLLVLGVIPMVVALVIGSVPCLYLGILMTVSAVGDVMIVAKVLSHRSQSNDMLLFDHPTEAGSVVFER